jgi:phosphopantetheinyl transferase (holo-ACP synthase)
MANFFKVDNNNMKIRYEIYPSTENGFINSRSALKILLNNEGLSIGDLKLDLALTNFRELAAYPQFLTSLSHTKNLGAAVLVNKSEVMGIGIDIEWQDRLIKPGAEKFFVNIQDKHALSPIELWTAKEAAFKALSPLGTFPGVLVLSKIIIQDNNFFTQEEPHLIGQFRVYHQSDYVFTIASLL